MKTFRSRKPRAVILDAALAACLAVTAVVVTTGAAAARDNLITTDPLAAALMPPPAMGSATFVPLFILPPPRIYDFEMPLEMQSSDRYPVPGFASRTPQHPINVMLTTPPLNAIFTRESMITFGWLPAEQPVSVNDAPNKVQFPIRYEIIISRHDAAGARIFIKASDSKRFYTHLYDPPRPGRYTWFVRAIYDASMHGSNSTVRTFTVLP